MMSRGRSAVLHGSARSGSHFHPACLNRLLIKLIRLTFDDPDGIARAFTEAGTETVTKVISSKNCFTINNFDCPFGTGRNTESATVTFLLIDFNNISFHGSYLLFC